MVKKSSKSDHIDRFMDVWSWSCSDDVIRHHLATSGAVDYTIFFAHQVHFCIKALCTKIPLHYMSYGTLPEHHQRLKSPVIVVLISLGNVVKLCWSRGFVKMCQFCSDERWKNIQWSPFEGNCCWRGIELLDYVGVSIRLRKFLISSKLISSKNEKSEDTVSTCVAPATPSPHSLS